MSKETRGNNHEGCIERNKERHLITTEAHEEKVTRVEAETSGRTR